VKIYTSFFLLIFCLLLSGQNKEQEAFAKANSFFDLKEYFKKETEKWAKLRGFQKSTEINGQKESHTFDTLNFAEEFAMFSNADINRLAWIDQYKVDSTYATDGSLSAISYQALRPDLQTQKVKIDFSEKQASFISIHRLMENALMNSSMVLEYDPGKSYRIQSNQKLRISEAREMIVEVVYPAGDL